MELDPLLPPALGSLLKGALMAPAVTYPPPLLSQEPWLTLAAPPCPQKEEAEAMQ